MRLSCSSSNEYSNIDVDDFLKKVMVSESFDEIADKIADRAAKKIRDMKNFEMSPAPESDANVEATYRVLSEFEQKNKTNSTSKGLSFKLTNSNSDNVLKDTVSKIDTLGIGIIKKEALNPIQGLSLKFRDFTRKTIFNHKVDVKQQDVDISKNNLSYEEKSRIEPIASIMKGIRPNNGDVPIVRANSQSKEEIDENSTALKEKTLDYSAESSNEDHMNQATQGQTENTHQLSIVKIESHSDSDEAPLVDSAEPDTLNPFTENIHISNTRTQPRIENEHERRSPVPDEDSSSLEYDVANNQDQSKINAVQTTIPTTSTTERHKAKRKKKTKSKLVRKEGGKTYTFESSPDYADYTQQIIKQQKNT